MSLCDTIFIWLLYRNLLEKRANDKYEIFSLWDIDENSTFGHHLLRNLLYKWWNLFLPFLDFSWLNLRSFFWCLFFILFTFVGFYFCDCDFRLLFESIFIFNLITMLEGLADRSVDADVHCFIIEHLGLGTPYRQLSVTIGLMSSIVK